MHVACGGHGGNKAVQHTSSRHGRPEDKTRPLNSHLNELRCAGQVHKVYVQDRIREKATYLWGLLEDGAHFYVCGDAAHMAGAVEVALLEVIETGLVGAQSSPVGHKIG